MKNLKTNKREAKSKKASTTKSGVSEYLRELSIDSLIDIYWAKKALTKTLPKITNKATSKKLIADQSII